MQVVTVGDYMAALEQAVIGLSGVRDLPERIRNRCRTSWRNGVAWDAILLDAVPDRDITHCDKYGHDPMVNGFCAICRERVENPDVENVTFGERLTGGEEGD